MPMQVMQPQPPYGMQQGMQQQPQFVADPQPFHGQQSTGYSTQPQPGYGQFAPPGYPMQPQQLQGGVPPPFFAAPLPPPRNVGSYTTMGVPAAYPAPSAPPFQ